MAFIQVSYLSKSLMRTVPINVILPTDKLYFPGMKVREDKPFKTLILLHGIFGSSVDWVNGTRIQRYAEDNDLAVIMPSGDNAFYTNHKESQNNYEDFVGKELIEAMRKMFPLSNKREDTFIGGLSMGGYGAVHIGLKYSETFSNIVSLSGAMLLDDVKERTNDSPFFIGRRDYAEYCFGDLENIETSENNPKYQIELLLKNKKDIPMIYMACGVDDSLLEANNTFAKFLDDHKVKYQYVTGPGAHEWDFWDTYIKKAVYEWLPVENSTKGINSGNVGI